MKRQKVKSSNIAEVGYDLPSLTLQIKFHNGSTYDYWPITKMAYDQFINSKSLGKFFYKNIRNDTKIHYRRVDL